MPTNDQYLALAAQRGTYDPDVMNQKSGLQRALGGFMGGYGTGAGVSSLMSTLVGANVWNPLGWGLGGAMALKGLLSKGKGAAKTAKTDYARGDAKSIMEEVYRNELGREMEPGAWDAGLKGLTGGKAGQWLGKDGLNYWIDQVRGSEEARRRRGETIPEKPASPVPAAVNDRMASKLMGDESGYASPL